MKKQAMRRLWFPFTIFAFFAAFSLVSEDFLVEFGAEAYLQSQKVIIYVVQVGIWISAAYLLNRLIVVVVWEGLLRETLGAAVPRLVKDILTIIVYVIALTGIVAFVFDKSVSAFWTTSGLVGLVLGFALRSIILDVFTGIAINIDRQYKIGDWIMVHRSGSETHITGQITEINWRSTRLHTSDDSVVVLPNSMLGTMAVTNYWGGGDYSRFETYICLDFSIPTERAIRVLLAGARAAVGEKGILEKPEPKVIVRKTTELGIEYVVRWWMSPWKPGQYLAAGRSHVTLSCLNHLRQAGITPAYPKQDLFYAEMPTRHLDSESLEDRTKLLKETELFHHLEHNELLELAAAMDQVEFSRDEQLISQGEAGDSMFILTEGLLHVFLKTDDGEKDLKVGQIIPGEFFGEMSLLTGEPRSATITAVTDVRAQEITKSDINGLLSNRPEIAEIISKVVAERRLRNSQSLLNATPEERIEQTESLARQIMVKMKKFFFGVGEKKTATA